MTNLDMHQLVPPTRQGNSPSPRSVWQRYAPGSAIGWCYLRTSYRPAVGALNGIHLIVEVMFEYLVDAANAESECPTLDARTVHEVTNKQNELYMNRSAGEVTKD